MKRTFFLFIFALTLALSAAACGDAAVPALEETETPAVSITVTEREPEPESSPTVEPETSRVPALFTESAYSATLLEYTGTALHGMDYPEATLFQDCLLIWNTTYSEMEEEAVLTLRLLALDTGEMEAETQITTMGFVQPQVCGSLIALCDSDSGLVQLLDENLNVTRKIQLQGDYSSWCMSSDGSALYRTPDYTSLSKTDLDTGTTSTLLSNAVDLYGGLVSNNGVNLTRLDSTTQTYQELWLDLDTGTVSEPPFDGSFSWVSCDNGLWLADLYRDSSVYYLGTDASPLVIDLEDGYLNLTEGGKRLIYTSSEWNFLALYDEEGKFVSSCTPPEGSWTGGTYLWSEDSQGYFFLLFPGEGEPELLFWDLNADSTGEDLETQLLTDEQQTAPGTAVDAALYERAEALGAACGVEIRIADQCELVYDDFEAEQIFDEAQISAGLDVLETALSTYPEGFFDQLKYRRIETIQINLTGTLTPTNENWGGRQLLRLYPGGRGYLFDGA